MTIEELAALGPDALEKLTDKELEEILRPYYCVTRPEMVVRKERTQSQQPEIQLSANKKAALAMLAEDGLDLSFLKRKRKPI